MVVFPLYTDSSKGKAQKNETVTALSRWKTIKKYCWLFVANGTFLIFAIQNIKDIWQRRF